MNFGNQLSNSHAFEAHELLIRNSGVVVVVVEACFFNIYPVSFRVGSEDYL